MVKKFDYASHCGLFVVHPVGVITDTVISKGDDKPAPPPTRVPLVSVHAEANVLDTVAETVLCQTYMNDRDKPIEAKYCFPLVESSAVTGFWAESEGKEIMGIVKEKVQAKKEYDEAISAGHGAYLMEQERPDIFQASVGNILPGKTVKVFVKYCHELSIFDKRIRFTLPTHIAPRYTPEHQPASEVPQNVTYVTPGTTPDMGANAAKLSLTAKMAMPSKIDSIESPSHPIKVSKMEGTSAEVTLALPEVFLAADIIIQVHVVDLHTPRVFWQLLPERYFEEQREKRLALADQTEGGGKKDDKMEVDKDKEGDKVDVKACCPYRGAAMMSIVPKFTLDEQKCELVFVLDRSGSMGGSRIEQSKKAMTIFLKSLPMDCYFSFISFGSSFSVWKPSSVKSSEATVAEALAFVSTVDADMGGTEILKPLEHLFKKMKPTQGYARQVFVLTDGQVSNEAEVVQLVKTEANPSSPSAGEHQPPRVFSLGIGSGVSTYLVKGIARNGNGDAQFVTDTEDLREAVIGQLKRALQPALANLTIEWEGPKPSPAPAPTPTPTTTGTDTQQQQQPQPEQPKKTGILGALSFFAPKQAGEKDKALEATHGTHAPATTLSTSDLPVWRAPFHNPPVFSGSHYVAYALFHDTTKPTHVLLKASSPEGPIELRLPLDDGNEQQQDGMLHRLAARVMLRDLEEGTSLLHDKAEAMEQPSQRHRYGRRPPSPELESHVKAEAIALGVTFGLASKWTSYLAIEKRTHTVLQPPPETVVVPQAGEYEYGGMAMPMAMCAMAAAPMAPGGMPVARSLLRGAAPRRLMAGPPRGMALGIGGGGARKGKHKKMDARGEIFGFAGFGERAKAAEADEIDVVRAEGAMVDRDEEEELADDDTDHIMMDSVEQKKADRPQDKAKAKETDALTLLVDMQQFNGSYSLNDKDKLLSVMGVSAAKYDELKAGVGGCVDDAVLLSALVVAYLHTRLADQKAIWELVAQKTEAFVRASCAGNADTVVAEAKKCVEGVIV